MLFARWPDVCQILSIKRLAATILPGWSRLIYISKSDLPGVAFSILLCLGYQSPIIASESVKVDLSAYMGTGVVAYVSPVEEYKDTGLVESIKEKNAVIPSDCRAINLKTARESILGLVQCGEGRIAICPGGLDNCFSQSFDTSSKGADFWVHPAVNGDANYRVEFSVNKFVYRIQERDCAVSYPHGCLIPGSAWVDKYVYRFEKTK